MIYGIGVDTASVARIEKSMTHDAFMRRVFGDEEREMLAARKSRPETAAANFAAKEAIGKALGVGITGFAWHEAQALRGDGGAPYYKFSGALLEFMQKNKLTAHLSLTHEGGFATAFAIIEKEERNR